jgi:hypothetical protein
MTSFVADYRATSPENGGGKLIKGRSTNASTSNAAELPSLVFGGGVSVIR